VQTSNDTTEKEQTENWTIRKDKIKTILSKLANRKILELDEIRNEVLKYESSVRIYLF